MALNTCGRRHGGLFVLLTYTVCCVGCLDGNSGVVRQVVPAPEDAVHNLAAGANNVPAVPGQAGEALQQCHELVEQVVGVGQQLVGIGNRLHAALRTVAEDFNGAVPRELMSPGVLEALQAFAAAASGIKRSRVEGEGEERG